MKSIQCKICNEIITTKGQNVNSLSVAFNKHLQSKHNMTHEEYVIQTDYNGIRPTCKCGCGKFLKFKKGVFGKYYSCTHVKPTPESIQKTRETNIKRGNIGINKFYEYASLHEEKLKEYYNDFINMKKSYIMICDECGIDKRTLKKYWKELKLIDNIDKFLLITRKHQGYWRNNISVPDEIELKNIYDKLPDIYNFLLENKHTYSINEIKNIFNINCRNNYLHELLVTEYGIDIIKYFNYRGKSRLEMEFFNILRFYYGKKVQSQFKIENKYYDYILDNKILIELDGTYWHNTIEANINDKYKDELAIKNGYILIRIKESEIQNLDILIKIREVYEKFKKI